MSKNIPDFDRKLKLLKENTETSVVDPMHNRPSTISTEKNVPDELMGLIGHGGLFDPPVNPIPVNDEFYWSRFDAYSTPSLSVMARPDGFNFFGQVTSEDESKYVTIGVSSEFILDPVRTHPSPSGSYGSRPFITIGGKVGVGTGHSGITEHSYFSRCFLHTSQTVVHRNMDTGQEISLVQANNTKNSF